MAIRHKGTFTVRFLNSDTSKTFSTAAEAHIAAQDYVGNNAGLRISPNEQTYLYGPGDGTTSVMIREDIEFIDDAEVSNG